VQLLGKLLGLVAVASQTDAVVGPDVVETFLQRGFLVVVEILIAHFFPPYNRPVRSPAGGRMGGKKADHTAFRSNKIIVT
jgi:hypothetical protein